MKPDEENLKKLENKYFSLILSALQIKGNWRRPVLEVLEVHGKILKIMMLVLGIIQHEWQGWDQN